MPNFVARFFAGDEGDASPILEWAPFFARDRDDARALAERAWVRARGGTLTEATRYEIAESGERVA